MNPIIKKISQMFESQQLSQESLFELEQSLGEISLIDIKGIRFSNFSESQQAGAIVLYAFLVRESGPFASYSLSELLDKILPVEKRVEALKTLLEIVRSILIKQRRKSETFDAIQKSFGFHSIYFIQMFKIKAQYSAFIDQNTFERLWLSFVFIERKLSLSELHQQLDLICTIMIMHLIAASAGRISLSNSIREFGEMLSYEIDEKDYAHYKNTVLENIPELLNPSFPLNLYHQLYLASLDKYSLDNLIFLEGIRNSAPNNITLTPMIKRSNCYSALNRSKAEFIYKSEPLKNISIKSEFNEVVNTLNSPEKQLLSPNLKRTFESTNHFIEFSKMYQWYKDQTKSVQLVQLSPSDSTLKASEYFVRFLDNSEILENYKRVIQTIAKVELKDRDTFLKLFFAILDKLLESEQSSSNLEGIRTLLRDKEFLPSALCLALEFQTYITDDKNLEFVDAVQICETNYLDVWKVLFIFAKLMGKNLPTYLRSRTLEIEIDILLKYLWTSTDEKTPPLAFNIFSFVSPHSDMVAKRILNVLAERLYLVTHACKLSEDIMEKTWTLLKKTLLYGYEAPEMDPEAAFKTNVHLDLIILSCVYHVGYLNKAYLHFKDLCTIYTQKVLVAIQNINDELTEFYHGFKDKIPCIHDDLVSDRSYSPGGNPNSTPIQGKSRISAQRKQKIMGSPLVDNLLLTLDKRHVDNFTGYPQGRHRLMSDDKLQFHKRIKPSEIAQNGMTENPNAISLFNIGESFSTVAHSPIIRLDNSPVFKLSTPAMERTDEPDDDGHSGARTPNFGSDF